MKPITKKQLQAIHNLLFYINHEEDHQPQNKQWQYKLKYANQMVKNGSVKRLHSTSRETQNLMNFLIDGMKTVEHKVSTDTDSLGLTESEENRIQGEAVYDGYWNNPLF